MSLPTRGSSGRRLGASAVVLGAAATSAPAFYLGVLTALGLRPHRCGRSVAQRFAIVVPAHNEHDSIDATLASLAALDYPTDLVDVTVVADNCTDDTASRARDAGVSVIERNDEQLRGKGYALELAFNELRASGGIDAIVVIDADTLVDPQLLAHAAFHLDQGAAAIQVDYRIRNPHTSWRTTLTDLAFTCKHRVRSRGRDAIGASAGLRGNGMVFSIDTLEATPYSAFSVVEDVEFAITLAHQGIAVQSCDATSVSGDMPATAESAHSQRVRWELGNRLLRRQHGWPLLSRALRTRSVVHADMTADVMMPPLASVGLALGAATACSAALRVIGMRLPLRIVSAAWVALAAHIAAGVALSQSGWRCLPALLRVPFYIVWKISVRLSASWRDQTDGDPVWSRTDRSGDTGADDTSDAAPTTLVSA